MNVTYSYYALKKYNEYRYTTICYSYSRLYNDICTRHSNKIDELQEVLIKHIREVCKKYLDTSFETELINVANSTLKAKSVTHSIQAEIKQIENEIKEYGNYTENLYIDKVNGVIDAEQFALLSKSFADKVSSYINRKSELELNLASAKDEQTQQEKIKKIAKSFLTMKKPTKELLNSLIDKIYISENHDIEIYYKFKILNEI